MIEYARIPTYTQEALRRWIEHGVQPGSFLRAVLRNDLLEAFSLADEPNAAALRDTVSWLANNAPVGCWGSPDAVRSWAHHMANRDVAEVAGVEG